jgi:hypothetical protein
MASYRSAGGYLFWHQQAGDGSNNVIGIDKHQKKINQPSENAIHGNIEISESINRKRRSSWRNEKQWRRYRRE